MKKILFILCLALTFGAEAQKLKGNKIVITQTRKVDHFSGIEVHKDIDVYFLNSHSQEVKVEADENLQDAIQTSVKNDVLTVNLTAKIARKKRLKVFVSLTEDVQTITANDDSNLHGTNTLKLDSLALNIHDNADANLLIKSNYFKANILKNSDVRLTVQADSIAKISMDGSAEMKLNLTTENLHFFGKESSKSIIKGSSTNATIAATDNATIIANEFKINTANLSASGSTDVYINTIEDLSIDASENCEIYIFSKPQITIENLDNKAILRKKEKMGIRL